MRSITSEEHIQSVRERGGRDFGFGVRRGGAFSVSACSRRKGNFAMVLRQIPSKLLTFEQIGDPTRRQGTPLQAAWSDPGDRPHRFGQDTTLASISTSSTRSAKRRTSSPSKIRSILSTALKKL